MDHSTYQVSVGDAIVSNTSTYQVQEILGSGVFGVVSLCHNSTTDKTVALKMLKDVYDWSAAKEEEAILQKLMDNGAAGYNIVQWFGTFSAMGHYCHEFEPLDISLSDYLRQYGPLELSEIRPIVHQMATALNFLKSQGIVHTDLKSDNIMMVHHKGQPLRIKVIDFGLALHVSTIRQGHRVQSRPHRAPEVFLGAHFNEAIDVWSLGCILTEMLTGELLFLGEDEYDTMRQIIHTVGMPPAELLQRGLKAREFFQHEFTRWEFIEHDPGTFYSPITKKLPDIFNSDPVNAADEWDRVFFLNLVEMMLKVNPDDRITPEEILHHQFITMDHLRCFRDLHPDHVSKSEKIMADVLGLPKCVLETPTTEGEPEEPSVTIKRPRDEDQDEDNFNKIMRWLSSEFKKGGTSLGYESADTSSPCKKKREEEHQIQSKSKDPSVKVDSPVGGKRRRDDGGPELVIISAVSPKRRRMDKTLQT